MANDNSLRGKPLDAEEHDRRMSILDAHGGNITRAAKEIGVCRATLQEQARRRNIDPGIAAGMAACGTGIIPTEGWIKVAARDGEPGYSMRVRPAAETAADIAASIRAAIEGMAPAPTIAPPEHYAAGKVALFPYGDVHVGIDIDADRGGTDYTPEIAIERLRGGFAACHSAIPPCETAIILNNGDLTHANDDRDVTPRNQHRLKVRGSHRQNLGLCVAITVWQIETALARHQRVIYRANRGNHDPNTPDTLGLALKERYRDNPRVTIDDGEREIWIWQRGQVFIAAHHGHGIKPKEMCQNLPAHFPVEFGASRHWFFVTAHLHHEKSDTFGPFRWVQLPSVCALDQNSADMGYADTAAMRAMMFCEDRGLQHDFTVRF